MHSDPAVHAVPLGFLVQIVPLQTNPVAQSAFVAQRVRQEVVPQTYGLHDCVVPTWHIPAPVPEPQRPASVAVPTAHESIPQTVPAA